MCGSAPSCDTPWHFELRPLSLKQQQKVSRALNLVNCPSKSAEGMGESAQLVIVLLPVIAKGVWGTRGAHGGPAAAHSDLFFSFPTPLGSQKRRW